MILATTLLAIHSSGKHMIGGLAINQKIASHAQLINQLSQLSQELNFLDQQRSHYVFLVSHNRISQQYQTIHEQLLSANDTDYASTITTIEHVLAVLQQLKSTMKLRNDYLFHNKTLKTILNSHIAVESQSQQVAIWTLLKNATNSSNLITLGEMRRSFTLSQNNTLQAAESINNKFSNIANSTNGVFETAKNIILNNMYLHEHVHNIQHHSSLLVSHLQQTIDKLQRTPQPSSSINTNLLYVIAVTCLLVILSITCWLLWLLHDYAKSKQQSMHLLNQLNTTNSKRDNNTLSNQLANSQPQNNDFYKFTAHALYHFLIRTQDIVIVIDKHNIPLICSAAFSDQIPSHTMLKNQLNMAEKRLYISYSTKTGIKKHSYLIDFETPLNHLDHKLMFLSPATNGNSRTVSNERLTSLGKISGEVAHDINNMLSIIIGCLNILRDSKSLIAKEDSKVIDRALFSADKSISIIDRLLIFACCQKLSPELVDVNDLIEGLYEVICFSSEKNINIDLELSPQIPIVYIDPGQLEACVINLCLNAMNAIDTQGTINIKTDVAYSDEQQILAISVTDDGHGIPSNIQQRIFEPFFTGQKKSQGKGLGLSMVYGFVKQSGGYINMDSEIGKGTTMTLVFELGAKS